MKNAIILYIVIILFIYFMNPSIINDIDNKYIMPIAAIGIATFSYLLCIIVYKFL